MIDDELVIEPDGGAGADLPNEEAIPLAERLVGQHKRILAGGAGRVIPETAGTFVGTDIPLTAVLR